MDRSYRASTDGLKKAQEAFRLRGWTKDHLAGRARCSRQTLWNFFARRSVNKNIFQSICNELGLEWENVLDCEPGQLSSSIANIDEMNGQNNDNQSISRSRQQIFPKAITLILENHKDLNRENLSQKIRVQAQTSGSLEIFGLIDPHPWINNNWTWEQIVKNLPSDSNQGWVRELEDSIYLAHCGRQEPSVVQWTFQSSDGRLFRPILYGMENGRDGSERFTVLFVKHISEGWVNNAPNIQLATLLTASILGARLQWEVCDSYLLQLDTWQGMGTEAIRKGLQKVKVSFENIEEDAKIRGQAEAPGQRNKDRLRDSFDSEEERLTIAKNMSEQEPHKQTLCNADHQENVDEVKFALIELARLNKIVIVMVAKRYFQLLNDNSF
ncbi:hypothetical protein [Nostoc sp.]|uniref:hypothetical protein n=1 Tax=Nostoc sp. TaxID=1180 RepID=UPI002FF9EC28